METTSLSLVERAKLALKNAKIAQHAAMAANTSAAKKALLFAQYATRVARWQPTFDSVIKLAESPDGLKAAKLACKLACYMETGRFSGKTGGSKTPHTVTRGPVSVLIEGMKITADNTKQACQMVRVSRGLAPLVGAFSAPREAARLGVTFQSA